MMNSPHKTVFVFGALVNRMSERLTNLVLKNKTEIVCNEEKVGYIQSATNGFLSK